MKRILTILTVVLAVVSCGQNGTRKALLPNVSGKAGEVIIVMDKAYWESAPGNEIRELLGSDCPWLYPAEALYSLVNVTPSGFADLFRVHRNIVLFNIDPQVTNPGVILKSDVWASPQCVIQVSAYDAEGAAEQVREKGESIMSAIEQAERDRVVRNCILYEERSIAPKVNEVIGGSPHFPSGYKLKKTAKDFVWVADEKQYVTQGILMYKYPAVGDESDFTEENIIAHRNEVLQRNVPGMFDGTYMTTGEFITPTVSYIKYKKRDFAQTRGFWEVFNDYMGGPFVSHSFYSKDGTEVVVEEAFVYAPRYDKRQYLRQVEAILYSFEWQKDEK